MTDEPYPFGQKPQIQTALVDGRLGGTAAEGDPDGMFPELWRWLAETFEATSALDVGCGVGHAMSYFQRLGLDVHGVEGSELVIRHHLLPERVTRHDLACGPWLAGRKFDVVWCCELAEHLPPEHASDVVATIAGNAGKVIAFCAAPPGCGGHNHVNCQEPTYWVDLFEKVSWKKDSALTEVAHGHTGPNGWRGDRNYFKRSGIILVPMHTCAESSDSPDGNSPGLSSRTD